MWISKITSRKFTKLEIWVYAMLLTLGVALWVAMLLPASERALFNFVAANHPGLISNLSIATPLVLMSSWIALMCNHFEDRPPGLSVMPVRIWSDTWQSKLAFQLFAFGAGLFLFAAIVVQPHVRQLLGVSG